jgi:hypothetical protein
MRRRALLRALGCVGLLLAIGASLLLALLRREPDLYRQTDIPEGPQRAELSKRFASQAQNLLTVGFSGDGAWSEEFTAEQINSYFAEDFVRVKPFKLPQNVNSPRIAIKPGLLEIGFRYGHGFWSTVVTADLNIWLAANEPNVVVVELLDIKAGALPVSMQSILEQIADNARRWNLDVNWYRHNDRPVALVRIQPDRTIPTVLLQRIELKDGTISIGGNSTEGGGTIKSFLSMSN